MNASLHRTKLFFLLFIILGSTSVSAQEREPWEIGLGIGYTNYYGDLSPYKIDGLRNLYRIADFNKYYQDRPSFSILLHRKLTPTLGFMVQANYLQFSMSDRYRNKSGNLDTTVRNYSRALNFQNNMKDIGIAFTFNANNGRVFAKDAFFYPSFYLGAGISQFTVKGDLYNASNNPYNYRLPGNINDGSYETNLRDLRTETENKYADVEPYVNLGLALNFRFSKTFSLAVQSDIKYSASDYLDDVSRLYKTTYSSPAEAYAARPGYNTVDPLTRARGDNNGMNDFYVNNRMVLHVALGGKPKAARFVAPVIYTLAPPVRLRKLMIDSARVKAVADSVAMVKSDLLLRARVDSVKFLQDSIMAATNIIRLNDSLTRDQLININAELKEIKSAIQAQQTVPGLNRIQTETDSIKALRQKIGSQKKQSQEDVLRLRIFDFQLDSLNREYEKEGKKPGNESVNVPIPATEESPEIREYSQEVTTLKKDNRYTSDTSFRNNVNVLEARLERYKEQSKKDAVAEKRTANTNAQRVDSLQDRIKYLESTSSAQKKSAEARHIIDTTSSFEQSPPVAQQAPPMDAVVKRRYEPVMTDTVAEKKKWYQRIFSTGPKDKKVEGDKTSADTASVKKNWFQRVFSIGPKDEKFEKAKGADEKVIADTASVKKNWFQRVFSTNSKDNQVVEEKAVRDTVVKSRPSARDEKVIMDTVTRKKKWYQRLFGTGAKDTLKSTSSSNPQLTKEEVAFGENNRRRPVEKDTVVQRRQTAVSKTGTEADAALISRRSPAARDTVSVNSSRIANVDPVTVRDTVELKKLMAESEKTRARNEQTVLQLQQQLKRSSDSSVFYRNALVEATTIKEDEPTEKPARRSIFSNRRKQQDQSRQREADNQTIQDEYLNQQRYHSGQMSQLQKRINDLQDDNRNLSNNQKKYDSEIRRRSLIDIGSTAAIIASSHSGRDSREMKSMREEIDRLKIQVNSQVQPIGQAGVVPSTDIAGKTAVIITTPPVVAALPVQTIDTTVTSGLKSEIEMLKEEIAQLKSSSSEIPKAVAPVEAPVPDLSSFPVVSVYFDTNSVSLAADQAAKLMPFAQAASTNTKTPILLKGFADATGNAALNRKIAIKRMESVKSLLLLRYRLRFERISTAEPQIASGSGSKKANPLDRRVDLVFQ
ncbi:MAG: hypothetical protein ABI151_09570 [Chitinophagaceae bacterium]